MASQPATSERLTRHLTVDHEVNLVPPTEEAAERLHAKRHDTRAERVNADHLVIHDVRIERSGGMGKECPACGLTIKSERHFETRSYDTEGNDRHSVRMIEEVTRAETASLRQLEWRFSKPDNSRKKPRLTEPRVTRRQRDNERHARKYA